MKPSLFLGVDVGTGSARAGVFDERGRRRGHAAFAINRWQPEADHVEQSSDDIWRQVARAARAALAQSGARPEHVGGVGFDATCSLVALDADGRPVTVSTTGRDEQNVVVWMDHRATPEAEAINAGGHPVLRRVGGAVSPEMQTPKLLWLKRHLPETWRRAAHFFDLPDYLTWRATGSPSRSMCSLVCKWTYVPGPHGPGWDAGFFRAVGLGDLVDEGFAPIGTEVFAPGGRVGAGLTATAAKALGLNSGTPVGVSMIDAHAGALGLLGMDLDEGGAGAPLDARLAMIGGTSTCHLAVSAGPRFVPGVWGPYPEALLPGWSLAEGGQSATGALIDHVVAAHAAGPALAREARVTGKTVYELLNEELGRLAAGGPIAALTDDLHVYPDFHGNRSPVADPTLRGMVSGLGLEVSREALARLYLAAIQGVAHGTRHVVDALEKAGWSFAAVIACGGGTKNPVFLQEHADALGRPLVLPEEPEAVLLGAALLGAVAAGAYPDLPTAMRTMSLPGRRVSPDPAQRKRHQARHAVYLRQLADQRAYRKLMADVPQNATDPD